MPDPTIDRSKYHPETDDPEDRLVHREVCPNCLGPLAVLRAADLVLAAHCVACHQQLIRCETYLDDLNVRQMVLGWLFQRSELVRKAGA
jgi:hypothetical protein